MGDSATHHLTGFHLAGLPMQLEPRSPHRHQLASLAQRGNRTPSFGPRGNWLPPPRSWPSPSLPVCPPRPFDAPPQISGARPPLFVPPPRFSDGPPQLFDALLQISEVRPRPFGSKPRPS